MAVNPLYLDFFRFLNKLPEEDPWALYKRLYLVPHEQFFKSYFESFNLLGPSQIAERVRKIKKGDYGLLQSLIQSGDPKGLAEEALKKCQRVLPLKPQPPVYLFIGFFSADGGTVDVDGVPSIALGLERFKSFQDLPLLVSHEYCHCAQRSLLKDFFPRGERPLFFTVVAEGLSVFFTEAVYPEIPLHRHLFLTQERLQWCQDNRQALLELAGADLAAAKLRPVLFGAGDPNAGIPPRVGYFVARQMLSHCLAHHGAEEFGRTFNGFEGLLKIVLEANRVQEMKEEEGNAGQ